MQEELLGVYEGGKYKLYRAVTGPLKTNNYLLMMSKEVTLIDAGPGVSELVRALIRRGLKVKAVLLTHGHFDHVADAYAVRKLTRAEVVMHELDKFILKISAEVAREFGIKWSDPEITVWLRRDNEVLRPFGNGLEVKVIHTPGHTPGSVTYYVPSLHIAFTGDTLFKGIVGATHFPGGSRKDLAISLRKLVRVLPDDTLILPGHGELSSLREEKTGNKYLRSLIGEI
jgi:hydroxyacylglutathione hydrolase